MAIEDNDVFDRAFEAAEAKLITDAESSAPEETAAETPDVVEAAEEKKLLEKPEESPKKDRARDESGKFTKSEKVTKATKAPEPDLDHDAKAEVSQSEEQEETSSQALQPVDAPAFWSAEEKALFAKAPREIQDLVTRKEAQRTQWVYRLEQESERGRAIEKRAKEVFGPYSTKLRAKGLDEFQAAERLLAFDDLVEQDPKSAIAGLMRSNNLTPYHFLEGQGQGQTAQPQHYQTDPRVDEALEKAEKAQKVAEEWKEKFEAEQQRQALSYVESFRQGKDSHGNVRATYFDMYRPHIVEAMGQILKVQPMSEHDALNHAYEFVLGEVMKLHGINGSNGGTGAVKPQADPVAQAKKAKAAASSVTGAPSSGVPTQRPRAKTIDEAIDRAFERAGL